MEKTENKQVGRPVKFTNKEIEDALREAQGILSLAADLLNKNNHGTKITRQALHTRINNSSTLSAIWEDVKERVLDFVEVKLLECIKEKDFRAIKLFLETRGKDRGYVTREEITGANGRDINPVHIPDIEVKFVKKEENES